MASKLNTVAGSVTSGVAGMNQLVKGSGKKTSGGLVSGANSALQNAANPQPTSSQPASSQPAAVNYYDDYYGGGSASSGSSGGYGNEAADNQTAISAQNIRDVQNQLARQLANYDFADAQNRALADTQLRQNSRKMSADRYEAQRSLQQAALGLLGSMGPGPMNGSTTGNLMRMLESRNDSDNNTYWAQHQVNQDSIENAYQDSVNQNLVGKRDAMQAAEKAIRDITSDWRAYMNNVDPDLFPAAGTPVGNDSALAPSTAWTPDKAKQNNAKIAGYVIPDNRGVGTTRYGEPLPDRSMNIGRTRNRLGGNDYFSQLMNRFNGR